MQTPATTLVMCTDYVAAIVSGLFGDYARIIYFIKCIYRNRHNFLNTY